MKTTKKELKSEQIKASEQTETPKRISKLWEASMKYQGTGRIIDMRAVMR
jgi:hypothetical protein